MNKTILHTILALSILLLTACSTTSNTVTFTPQTIESDKAAVYIYRPNVMSNALYAPGINVDGEFKLNSKNGSNAMLLLPPGEHVFMFQADNKYTELTPTILTLSAGTTSYIKVTTGLHITNSPGYEPYSRSFALTEVAEEVAIKEITECCTDDKKPADDTESKPVTDTKSDTFSVDKTQNPFSR